MLPTMAAARATGDKNYLEFAETFFNGN